MQKTGNAKNYVTIGTKNGKENHMLTNNMITRK